ncbi:MAG: CoA-acylating methylmalonate-semialdehyde dehydrogenase [Archangium sp.]|nr:CoA-acylating methylmalonate-semialdehyde dehydrogenase [Archangium sp.]MDP3153046.1 CoA-acylating methylmalonate-semialdehyde dehydrogenase [Archangium sp.]MDP3572567.1 CoA-acylating methylmalonate-semialdehyde dehydrogenase [Archangium sp.]
MQKPANPPSFSAKSYAFTEYVSIKNWIGGNWREGATGNWLDIENPRHGKAMGKMTISTAKDVDAAVEAGKKAFPHWKATPMRERAQVLFRLKALMERDLDELSWLVSHENGKTYAEGKGDVEKGIECVEFAASLHMMADGGQLDVSRGVNCQVTHEPLGVVAGIVPFNFPVMVPLWMAPNAIMAGNAFILKPSEVVPYGAMKLASLWQEAGLPDGIFNVVNGQRETVEAIVDHPEIKAVGFVGSTKVAQILYARGAATGKRMLCLGSAKNHVLVAPDADVALTSSNIVASSYGCAGQRCMASSLMVAIGDVQKIIDGIADHVRKIRLGEDMGSIISGASRERILKYIEAAEKAGAKVVVDGRGKNVPGHEGHWIGPTVLDNVTIDMPAGCEEIFGPVLSIVHTKTLDEAINLQHKSLYANGAAIFTTSGAVARQAAERLEAGMVGINVGVPVPREPFSFGGFNASKFGHGDITGWDGFRFWSRPKKVTEKWAAASDASWMS